MADDILKSLSQTIAARRQASASDSYTRQLLDGGIEICAKKLGEEATETIFAALAQDDEKLIREAADLLYHMLVMLEAREVKLDDVLAELERRAGQSGLSEKAGRKS